MKWITEDIRKYVNAKEYIDTIIFPLYPVSFDYEINECVSMYDFITEITSQLERQFIGRLLLLPGFPYLKTDNINKYLVTIQEWEKELLENGFKHIFYVTSDSSWKELETNLKGSLLWLPSIPISDMEQKYRNSIIENQVKQLIHLFIQKWR